VVLFGNRWPSMWTPRSATGSTVSVLGGLPHVARVDQIALPLVVQAWRQLPSRPEAAARQLMESATRAATGAPPESRRGLFARRRGRREHAQRR
jgi:heptosyltransferase-2/heptosyltransferase-3